MPAIPICRMKGKKDGLQKYRVRINCKNSTGDPEQLDRVVFGLEEAKELERGLTKTV